MRDRNRYDRQAAKVLKAARTLKSIQSDYADWKAERKKYKDELADTQEKWVAVCEALIPAECALGQFCGAYEDARLQFEQQIDGTMDPEEIKKIALAYGSTVKALDLQRAAILEEYAEPLREQMVLSRKRDALESRSPAIKARQVTLVNQEMNARADLEHAALKYSKSKQ